MNKKDIINNLKMINYSTNRELKKDCIELIMLGFTHYKRIINKLNEVGIETVDRSAEEELFKQIQKLEHVVINNRRTKIQKEIFGL